MDSFDYIIVGAGSAGCVLANRLSADGGVRVLLIEAGGEDRNPYIPVPMGVGKTLSDPRLNWWYPVEAGNAFRTPVWMRGRGLGGSSSINGMMYMRGQPKDYDGWEALGNPGWGWREMGRCFRAMEDHELGDDGVRGSGGPLHVSIQPHRSPLTEAILASGERPARCRSRSFSSTTTRPAPTPTSWPRAAKAASTCRSGSTTATPIRGRASG